MTQTASRQPRSNSKAARSRRANDRAVHLQLAGQFEEARKAYARAIELHPGNANAHHNFAFLLAELAGRDDAPDYSEALAHARRACDLAPTRAGYTATLAQILFASGAQEEAIELAELALGQSPDDAPLTDQLARLLILAGRPGRAAELLAGLAPRVPFEGDRHLRWATAEALRGNLAAAQRVLGELLQFDPECAAAWAQLGSILYLQKDLGSAREALHKALGIDRRAASALRHLALVEVACGNTEQAIRAYHDYLALAPRDHATALDLSVLLLSAKQPEAARELLAQIDGSRVDSDRLRFYRAMAERELGRRAAARKSFTRLARGESYYADQARRMLAV